MTDAQQALDHIRQAAQKDLAQHQDKVDLAYLQAARLVQGIGAVLFLLSLGLLLVVLTGHADADQAGVVFPYLLFVSIMLFVVGRQIRSSRPSPSANQLD